MKKYIVGKADLYMDGEFVGKTQIGKALFTDSIDKVNLENEKMLLTHLYVKCLSCGEELEVFSDDMDYAQKDCILCGYSNEFTDIRVEVYEKEF